MGLANEVVAMRKKRNEADRVRERFRHAPLPGCLLVAAPNLTGSMFARSVVLVIHHGGQGSVGLVLNRRLGTSGRVIWQQRDGSRGELGAPIYIGGPLIGPLVALHQDETLCEYRVTERLFLASNVTMFSRLAESDEGSYRLIVGRAGWAPRQLEAELRRGIWFVLPAEEQLVFGDPCDLWVRCLHSVGKRFYAECIPGYDPRHDASAN